MFTRTGNEAISVEEDFRTIIDNTTNTLYLYVSENMRPAAASTDTDWRCSRITVATGSLSWADGVSTFTKQASLAATYTYA